MPLYEYKCPCKNEESRLASVKDRDLQECSKCGTFMERKISSVGKIYAPSRKNYGTR